MNAKDLELLAAKGENLPDGLGTAEQLLFLKLRYLYAMCKLGKISREQGAKEKTAIYSQYKHDDFNEKLYRQNLGAFNRLGTLLPEANKSDCERCKRLVRVLTGIENCENEVN